ncbi:hypothetical protein [Mesorhizobium captivum]|uniref:hypothetical protein n=1 Tax=Mesorhizobium captivum TaxID=3072319 RepID=UPI002A24AB0B|nr:hypothetical protein [Mesorhizobium sp. VK3C]MDX8446003.1 hypothetical protein [Mesorhizobium sp. VK3C]
MKKLAASFDLAAFFAGVIVTVWLASGKLWSASVDVAHHYALVKAIIDHFPVRGSPLPNLGEMNTYPAFSHFVAATISPFFASGMMAMFAIGVASIFVVYAAIAVILFRVSRSGATMGVVALLLLATLGVPVHGYELRANYFYSQIVGDALAYAMFAWVALYGRDRFLLDAAVYIAAIIIGYAHLIPALQILGAYGFLLFTYSTRSTQHRLRLIAWAGAGAAYLAFHPALATMIKIGEHEGSISLLALDAPYMTPALLAAALAIAAWALVQSIRSDDRTLRVLASLLVATFALSVGLIAAHDVAGMGSVYGFKKTLFAVATLTSGTFFVLITRSFSLIESIRPSLMASVSAVLLTFASLGRPTVDAHRLEVLRNAIHYSGYEYAPDKPVAVVEFPELPPPFNYLLTIGELGVPRDSRGMAVLLNDFKGVDGIQWELGDPVEGCQSQKVGAIYRTDFACWVAKSQLGLTSPRYSRIDPRDPSVVKAQVPIMIAKDYAFDTSGAGIRLIGWSSVEPTHRWSLGPSNAIELRLPSPNSVALCAVIRGGTYGPQTIGASVDGKQAMEQAANGETELVVPLGTKEGDTTITLTYSNPQIPPNDPRQVAFALRSIRVDACP